MVRSTPKVDLEKYNPNPYGIESRPKVSGGFN